MAFFLKNKILYFKIIWTYIPFGCNPSNPQQQLCVAYVTYSYNKKQPYDTILYIVSDEPMSVKLPNKYQ